MLEETWKIYTYDSVASTMDQAVELIAEESQFAVLAYNQTNGRGRQGRQWQSFEENLFTTLAFKPSQPCKTWGQVSFVAALAVGEVIQDYLSNQQSHVVQYKWPNDILVSGKKIAGILLEIIDASWLLVGIGINLKNSPEGLPYLSTSLKELEGGVPSPETALLLLMKYFTFKMKILEEKGFSEIRSLWLKSGAYLGKEIEVRLHKQGLIEKINGRFIDLDEEGTLLLELPNKEIKRIFAGDVLRQD
ncbi:MAG: biotin--[acetyl-CoA-carboxylase] ligase [Caedibacter sp. 37-49]|nr:MAG: biotin--[acetyl-CoA-carboxylase] ligase [Caedibacter sp. 37-49]